MTEKFIQRTGEFELDESLQNSCGLSREFLEVLNLRGINSKEKIESFLAPKLEEMSSPFEIDQMDFAVERIKRAIESHERILIYGDYDCDGICAVSIFMLYLRSQNANAIYFIPNRNVDGYGMSLDTLMPIVATDKPDLLITVDCGITAVKEVDYLKENGVDVIVTDHHEPQDELPNCIIVDPKIKRKGFYEFCGAGVALKVVEGLSNRENIAQYLDIAAIATIADIVPLVDENRIIAYHGVAQLNKSMRKGISMLLGSLACNSYEIMYRLAPRINAAGRMDTAMKAVDIFLSDDYFVLEGLTKELSIDNVKRQELCEKVVKLAKEKLAMVDFSDCRFIALYDESWEAGVLGIAASRLAEEFNRPTILFTLKEGQMRGSARSVKGINIFEVFSKCSSLFVGFGGHAQAAGVSMEIQNFCEFQKQVNEELKSNFSTSFFQKKIQYDLELDLKSDLLSFAKEIERLEPTGFGNPKPNFKILSDGLNFKQIGTSNHIKYVTRGYEVIGFTKIDDILSCRCKTNFDVSLSRNIFQNNETAQLCLRNICVEEVKNLSEEEVMLASIHQLAHLKTKEVTATVVSDDELAKLLEEPFGTLFVCFTLKGLSRITHRLNQRLPKSVGATPNLNPENQIVLCPGRNFDFRYFNNIVLADLPSNDGYAQVMAKSGVLKTLEGATKITFPSVSVDLLREVFVVLKSMAGRRLRMQNFDIMHKLVAKTVAVTKFELAVAFQAFHEVHLLSESERGIIEVSNKQTNLSKSATITNLKI